MRVFWKCLLLVLATGVLIAQTSGKAFGRTPPKPATEAFSEFMSLLDTFAPLFPIVTPRGIDDSFTSGQAGHEQ